MMVGKTFAFPCRLRKLFRGKLAAVKLWGGEAVKGNKNFLDHHCVLQELKVFNLGSVPESEELTRRVKDSLEGPVGGRLSWVDG